MKNTLRLAALATAIAAAAAMSGCATPANSGNMVVRAATATDLRNLTPEALKTNIAVRDVTGGKETNPAWVSNIGSADFMTAIEESLRSVGMLAANKQAGKLQLVAHLEKVDQPFLGFDMTVTTTVAYTLIDRASGKTVWKQTLAAPYTAKLSDAFAGFERLRLANEGSVRENVTRLIQGLQTLKASDITVQ